MGSLGPNKPGEGGVRIGDAGVGAVASAFLCAWALSKSELENPEKLTGASG